MANKKQVLWNLQRYADRPEALLAVTIHYRSAKDCSFNISWGSEDCSYERYFDGEYFTQCVFTGDLKECEEFLEGCNYDPLFAIYILDEHQDTLTFEEFKQLLEDLE